MSYKFYGNIVFIALAVRARTPAAVACLLLLLPISDDVTFTVHVDGRVSVYRLLLGQLKTAVRTIYPLKERFDAINH